MTIEVPVRRSYGRTVEDMRPLSIAPNALPHAEGSAYIKVGDTHVLCAATVEERVPPFRFQESKLVIRAVAACSGSAHDELGAARRTEERYGNKEK